MLVKTAFALSVAALATAAPLQESRRSVDLSKRSDIVDTAVGTTIGKNSGAAVVATVSDSGDVDAEVAAKLGNLLGLDTKASLGLSSLLKSLLTVHHKRDDIVNSQTGVTVGKNSGAAASVVVGGNLDTDVDVDAKLGHLLGLNADVSVGLGSLLKNLLGGLLGKRDLSSEELYKRANDDLVDVGLGSTIGQNSHADASATVGKNLDTSVDVDSKIGNLLGLELDAGVSISNLLKSLLTIHHKRDDISLSSNLDILHLIETNTSLRLGLSQLLSQLVHIDIQTKRSLVSSSTVATADSNGIVAGTAAAVGSSIDAGALAVANKDGVFTEVKGDVGQISSDTQAALSSSGLNLGSYVKDGSSVVGAGFLSSKDGTSTGLVAQLGNLLGVEVNAQTTPILRGILAGLISKN